MKARSARFLTDLPILYSFRRCPYAIRARMALAVANISVEHREITLRSKPAEMIAASPKGTVPVLVLPGGRVIEESLDIMRWALDHNDPEGWLAHTSEASALINVNDGPFKHHLDRMKYPSRYDSDPVLHQSAALALLAPLESRLASMPFLFGNRVSLADIAILPFIRQFAQTDDAAWRDFPLARMRDWLAGLTQLPLFIEVMTKHPLWTGGAAHSSMSA
jgi:glutathione S-transferase